MISRIGIKAIDKHEEGFTLIELILVMAILSMIVIVASPSLSRFIYGRSLLDEARRIVALTHFASHQSISSGVPLWVWFEEDDNLFGLRAQNGYETEWEEEYVYHMDENIQIDLQPHSARQDDLVSIYCFPDGTMEIGELIYIRLSRNEDSLYIAKETVGMGFRILNEKEFNNEVWIR